MTTVTDKELIKEIKERIGSLDVRDNIERRAYEIALASLEAEPVLYMNRFTGKTFSLEGQPGADKEPEIYVPLYTAPPAPVVPDEVANSSKHLSGFMRMIKTMKHYCFVLTKG